MKTLLVDNHDSYTYNVFHLLAAASGEEPMVVNNDAVSWRVLTRMDFDAIVLSPGPGHPSRWHDFGVCSDILRHSEVPVFGICLGHQGIGNLLEGDVKRAPMAMHGRLSRVMHEGKGLFRDVPQGFSVVRYHSLAITTPPGPEGSIVAWSDDGVVMGVEHTRRPIWGVQFHPESISTEFGLKIAENFFALAAQHRRTAERPAGCAGAPRGCPDRRLRTPRTCRPTCAEAPSRRRRRPVVPRRSMLPVRPVRSPRDPAARRTRSARRAAGRTRGAAPRACRGRADEADGRWSSWASPSGRTPCRTSAAAKH